MTDAERLDWGKREDIARKDDLAAVKIGTMTLAEAQKNARRRVRQSGMTRRESYGSLCDAQRAARGTV